MDDIHIIEDLLTLKECNKIIRSKSIFTATMRTQYENGDTDSWQMLFSDKALVALIDSRIRSWAKHENFDMDGLTIFPKIRLVHYYGGQLKPLHRDSIFRNENGKSTQYICIIYLNDDFEGGNTVVYPNFTNRCKMEYNSNFIQQYGAEIKKSTSFIITPSTGRAVLYSVHLPHEGRKIHGTGEKWLIIARYDG